MIRTMTAIVLALGFPAWALACDEAERTGLQEDLGALIASDPDVMLPKVEAAVAEVEAEYGGEPAEDETCDALRKVIDMAGGA